MITFTVLSHFIHPDGSLFIDHLDHFSFDKHTRKRAVNAYEKPTPKDNEVLIKIHATAVTASDIFIHGSQIPIRFWIPMRLALGLTKPRKSIIGLVLAGEIEAVGAKIKRFQPGDWSCDRS